MDNMKVFTCRDRYDDMATCIYEAWSMALQVGHDHVMLMKEPVEQLDMFADYIHVEPDADKVQKFTRSVKKVSWLVYRNVFNALLSHQEDALDTVYRYLILAFAEGRKVEHMLISPEVMRIMELGRSVSNEAPSIQGDSQIHCCPGAGVCMSYRTKGRCCASCRQSFCGQDAVRILADSG